MKIKTALLSALPAAALLVAWAPAASASTVAVQPDGKIVLAGYASLLVPPSCAHRCYSYWLLRPAAVRLDADGHPDPSFGSRGGVVDFRAPPFGAPEFASVVLPPGRGVRLGWANSSPFRITALDGRGVPDLGFGRGGLAAGTPVKADSVNATTILSQPDGSLTIGGQLETLTPKTPRSSISVGVAMHFSPSGSPGRRLGEISMGAGNLVQLADLVPEGGRFIAVGRVTNTQTGGAGAYLARFTDSAFPYDPSFGGGSGLIRLGFVDFNGGAPTDGRLIAVGGRGGEILLARYDAAGMLDQGFGEGGMAVASLPASLASLPGEYVSAEARAVTVQPDGRYLVAGRARVRGSFDVCGIKSSYCEYVFLVRFEPDGSLDPSFGEGGFVTGRRAGPRLALALQPDGRILLSESSLHVTRYNSDGSLDESFGDNGEASVLPCQGTLPQRRRSGCLSTAAVSFKVHGVSHGKPVSQFSIRASNPLDPVAAVKFVPPPELEGRKGTAGNVRVLTVPRTRVRTRVGARVVSMSRFANARGVHVAINAGVLRRIAPIAAARRPVFRIEVKFKDGTRQRFGFRSPR